ncbi:MAG TPA: maleylpyruvate isomerase family mycothiol-dependent enzyme [Acidimicrobiales bacterium]|nr:maleylpyruvate isomerase family mycothiol-dependent enzyme [Acidimicrobiales bacterium]
MQPDEIYEDTRARLTAFVRQLGDDDLARPVAACPGWTVRDVVAHLTGVAVDITAGRTEGLATSESTARQVAERAGRSLDELLDEWAEHAPALGRLVRETPRMARAVVDLVTHEYDICGPVESVGFDYSLQAYVTGLDYRLRKHSLPPLRVRAGDEEWELGGGDPATTMATSPTELFRALAGRRSVAQVRAFDWDGDASPYVPVMSTFGPLPEDDVVE